MYQKTRKESSLISRLKVMIFFSNKTTNFEDKIILVEKGAVVSKNEEIATHFNNYFNDITKGLNIEKWCIPNKLSDEPLVNAIRK